MHYSIIVLIETSLSKLMSKK